MRTSKRLGHIDTLSSRLGPVRKADPDRWWALWYIHQDGYEKAYLANERFRQDREARLRRIKDAEDKGEEPRPRDIRPHRRTLKHRRRKNVQSLTVNSHHHLPLGMRLWHSPPVQKRVVRALWKLRFGHPEARN